jgi:hypothetical protein
VLVTSESEIEVESDIAVALAEVEVESRAMQMYSPTVLSRRVSRKLFWDCGGNHEHVRTIALQGGVPGCHLVDRKSP